MRVIILAENAFESGKGGHTMDYLSKNISINLKKLRLGKKMSLDDVAEQTGVSKSMLGQIERGDLLTPVCSATSSSDSYLPRRSFLRLIEIFYYR